MDDVRRSNAALNKYFSEEACMPVADTRHLEETVMKHVSDMVRCVNEMDRRFGAEPLHVGSAYQKLKVNLADDYDIDIPLIGIDRSDITISQQPLHFGFEQGVDESVTTMVPDLRIIGKGKTQENPGVEYYAVRLNQDMRSYYKDFTYKGFLVPYLVRIHLIKLIKAAIKKLRLRGISLDHQIHGPALTLNVKHWDSREPAMIRVNVDVALVLRNMIAFDAGITDWEDNAIDAGWPDLNKVDEILDLGINLVAKKNFHWVLSFAECEKAVVHNMDVDKGNRRKVHRIMKALWREASNDGQVSKLSSYVLKNVWLSECERFSDPGDWSSNRLSTRYYCCMKKLTECVHNGDVPLYFCSSVNLLKGISHKELDEMMCVIEIMKMHVKDLKAILD